MINHLIADKEKYSTRLEEIKARRARVAAELDQLARDEACICHRLEYVSELLVRVEELKPARASRTTRARTSRKPEQSASIATDAVTDTDTDTAKPAKLSDNPAAVRAREARARKRAQAQLPTAASTPPPATTASQSAASPETNHPNV